MDMRTITKKRMGELALILVQDDSACPMEVLNPEVFVEVIVDRYRTCVRVEANYMTIFDMTREMLFACCKLRGIKP